MLWYFVALIKRGGRGKENFIVGGYRRVGAREKWDGGRSSEGRKMRQILQHSIIFRIKMAGQRLGLLWKG